MCARASVCVCVPYKGMYRARHDRIVDLIVKDISNNGSPSVRIYKHSCVNPLFQCLSNNSGLSANTPDVVVM